MKQTRPILYTNVTNICALLKAKCSVKFVHQLKMYNVKWKKKHHIVHFVRREQYTIVAVIAHEMHDGQTHECNHKVHIYGECR